MNQIDLDTLITLIGIWENERLVRLPAEKLPFFSQGGWEGWLQVELAMYFTGANYNVVREQHAYNDNRRADLVFNNQIPGVADIVVEIKCESINVEKAEDFCWKVLVDEFKLSTLPNGKCGLMLVGATEPELEKELVGAGYTLVPTIQHNMHIYFKVIKIA